MSNITLPPRASLEYLPRLAKDRLNAVMGAHHEGVVAFALILI
jgi:hypothetical protein